MKSKPTIGILAGMGPYSTGAFVDLVVRECELQYGAKHDIDYPKMMILSLPAPFYPDRPIDHAAMERTLSEGVRDLANAGCDFISIACNTAHIYHAQLARGLDVPLLSMVELGVAATPSTARSVALIAARPTVESGIYQDGLRRRGLTSLEVGWQSESDHLIGSVRLPPEERAIQWRGLASRAAAAGADVLLLACADLTAISGDLVTELPIVDATQCLARGIVAEWLRAP